MPLTHVTCAECGRQRPVERDRQGYVFSPGHVCVAGIRVAGAANPQSTKEAQVSQGVSDVPAGSVSRRWSAAVRTTCERGHSHGSKLESRVCGRVHAEARSEERILVHARIPLLILGPQEPHGRPLYFTPDFAIVAPGLNGRPEIRRAVDAKGRTSPEWARGVAAFVASYGVRVEIVTK